MSRARVWRVVGAAVSGVALVAAGGAAVVWGPDAIANPPSVDTAAAHRSTAVDVPPGDQTLVCPGPARLTDGSSGGDPQFKPDPVGTTTWFGALGLAGGNGKVASLTGSSVGTFPAAPDGTDASALDRSGVDAPLVVRVPAAGDALPRAAASVASTTTAGDLRGLAAASCLVPATDSWLVGGDTKVGDSSQLVLANAGLTAATVTVNAYGDNGKVALGSSASLVVPPGKEVVRLIESAAEGQDRLAVDVKTAGGAVAAYLQHSSLDGIVPQGVDFVVPSAGPGEHVAVAGVVSRGEAITDPRAPVLRLLAPDQAATATVSLWGPKGRVRLRGAENQKLAAGSVVDVGLGGLPAGTYTVTVDATADVVAGVGEQRPGKPASGSPRDPWDLAWSPAQALTSTGADAGAVALTPKTSGAVSLTALPADRAIDAKLTGGVKATVRLFGRAGKQIGTKAVTLAAGSTTTLDTHQLGGGKSVAGVSVDGVATTGGAELTWGVVESAGDAASGVEGPANGQLFSVLAPVLAPDEPGTVTVVADPTVGLG